MKNAKWVAAAVAALGLGVLTLPRFMTGGLEPAASGAAGQSCKAEGAANLNLTLKDMHDADYKLSSLKGKVVLVNFWASWCGPCIQETPALVQLHHEHPDLAILAVSNDEDPGAYQRFLQRFHVDYTTVRDPDEKVAKMYGTDGWPETYIIDRNGIVRRKVVGDPDWSNPEMRAYLRGL